MEVPSAVTLCHALLPLPPLVAFLPFPSPLLPLPAGGARSFLVLLAEGAAAEAEERRPREKMEAIVGATKHHSRHSVLVRAARIASRKFRPSYKIPRTASFRNACS